MAARTDSRQRMLDSARELFQAQGYHATGLNQIVAAGKAPKGSLYFHFPGGKEQLAAEAMQQAAETVRARLEEIAAAAPDAATAIGAAVDLLGTALVESDFRGGCPLAAVAQDAGPEAPLIAAACSAGYASWRASIAGLLERHGASAERAEGLAMVVLSLIEGALLLAKTDRDIAPVRAARAHLMTLLSEGNG
ncbi:TetR/AcrR family transcriptional regulator [Pseudonocardia sp. TRM90224]|uniref:TetR/AcrR family transcriptional regulator n=1 Tax=Pseudonocardia sp. TRM90224 TaxID=2812678 RepID=UPI001E61C7D1|nr:TetR/AcrR family transcriptional regulator [Pseudonocardia sp. TRM90224]